MHAVIAILAALVQRAATGQGAYLDVSVADGVLALMALHVDEYLATGDTPHNVLTGRYACYDTYEAADGRWLAVAAIEPRFWANLCRLLDLEQYAGRQYDDAQDEIRAALATAFAGRSRDAWVELLAGADTCVSPVLDVAEAADDAGFAARSAVARGKHPSAGEFRQLAPLLAGAERRTSYELPDLTETDIVAVLAGSGYPTEEIDALLEQGVVQ
jgi:alpha-methylacyl-CoA racemase